ncbi:MAG: hypothetical protein QN716_12300, partial [Nitrososphaeraceae archaeon]|nr:hypothetical protein [Nitrososphaeraceae archaeon]
LKIDSSKLRYKVNYNPINFNNDTRMYKTGSQLYNRYEQARANQWKCEKCNNRFATFRKLRQHKSQNHSY